MLPLDILLSSIDGVWIGSAADYPYRVGVPVIGFGSLLLSYVPVVVYFYIHLCLLCRLMKPKQEKRFLFDVSIISSFGDCLGFFLIFTRA